MSLSTKVFTAIRLSGHPRWRTACSISSSCSHTVSCGMHYALVHEPRFGAERRVFTRRILMIVPIFPFDNLSAEQRSKWCSAFQPARCAKTRPSSTEIDTFFGSLFGLDRKDMEVVRDTVEVAMPYIESRDRACNPPRPAERERFRKRLESILRPFFKVTGDEPQVELWKPDAAFLQTFAPFGLLLISKRGTRMPAPDGLFRDVLLKLAEDTGSTRIIQHVDGGLRRGVAQPVSLLDAEPGAVARRGTRPRTSRRFRGLTHEAGNVRGERRGVSTAASAVVLARSSRRRIGHLRCVGVDDQAADGLVSIYRRPMRTPLRLSSTSGFTTKFSTRAWWMDLTARFSLRCTASRRCAISIGDTRTKCRTFLSISSIGLPE